LIPEAVRGPAATALAASNAAIATPAFVAYATKFDRITPLKNFLFYLCTSGLFTV
jgi:hypothetical protein